MRFAVESELHVPVRLNGVVCHEGTLYAHQHPGRATEHWILDTGYWTGTRRSTVRSLISLTEYEIRQEQFLVNIAIGHTIQISVERLLRAIAAGNNAADWQRSAEALLVLAQGSGNLALQSWPALRC